MSMPNQPSSHNPGQLQVGPTLQRGIQVISENPKLFVALATIIYMPLFIWSLFADSPQVETEIQTAKIARDMLALLLLQLVMNAAAVDATLRHLDGENSSVTACLSLAFQRLYHILAVTILQTLYIGLPVGLSVILAVTVPFFGPITVVAAAAIAIFMMVIWWLAIPCNIAEWLGANASLERSAQLTAGSRPQIFALVVIFAVGGLLAQFIALQVGATIPFLFGPVSTIATALVSTVSAVVASTVYYDLRQINQTS